VTPDDIRAWTDALGDNAPTIMAIGFMVVVVLPVIVRYAKEIRASIAAEAREEIEAEQTRKTVEAHEKTLTDHEARLKTLEAPKPRPALRRRT
jgi:hypothetical protein